MSERRTSGARFWATLKEERPLSKAALPGDFMTEPPPVEPPAELPALAKRIREILASVQAATVFELQIRLGVESEPEILSAARALEERGLVTISNSETDVVVSLRG